jgi:uncharacterized protein
MNLFNDIEASVKAGRLAWLNEPRDWRATGDGIAITAGANADFFIDEEGPCLHDAAPFLHATIDGDFALTARVTVNMRETFDSGCLMIMEKPDRWAKLCYENWMNKPSICSVVTNGYSDDCPSREFGSQGAYLKILRSGNCFGFHASNDGKNWEIIRYFNFATSGPIKVGIVAQSPVGESCEARFSQVELVCRTVPSAKRAD